MTTRKQQLVKEAYLKAKLFLTFDSGRRLNSHFNQLSICMVMKYHPGEFMDFYLLVSPFSLISDKEKI